MPSLAKAKLSKAKKFLLLPFLSGSIAACGSTVQPAAENGNAVNILAHEVERIDGTTEALDARQGSVLLIVNVASKCGFTSQYEGLQELYELKSDEGLVVMGFPSNQFMGQEPGTNEEIQTFCSTNYGVTFPMYAKLKVKGDGAHPLFKDLVEAAGEPSWNFNKYLIDRSGNVVARFGSSVKPSDPELVSEIDRLLAES